MDKELEHLARLALLRLSERDAEEVSRRLRALRALIDRLLEAPVDGLEPLFHPVEQEGLLREDKPRSCGFDLETAKRNAAGLENGYFVAPRTVEE